MGYVFGLNLHFLEYYQLRSLHILLVNSTFTVPWMTESYIFLFCWMSYLNPSDFQAIYEHIKYWYLWNFINIADTFSWWVTYLEIMSVYYLLGKEIKINVIKFVIFLYSWIWGSCFKYPSIQWSHTCISLNSLLFYVFFI